MYRLNPYNSSLYRMTASEETGAVLLVQTPDRHPSQILPASHDDNHSPDFIGIDNDDGNSDEAKTSDDDHEDDEGDDVTVFLAKRVDVTDGGGGVTTAGVAGVQVKLDALQHILMNATSVPASSQELSCADRDTVR